MRTEDGRCVLHYAVHVFAIERIDWTLTALVFALLAMGEKTPAFGENDFLVDESDSRRSR